MNHDPIILTAEVSLIAPIEKAWLSYVLPEHIMKWNQASPDWCCPSAVNDLQAGGDFTYRMEAKDGSFGFDFGGIFNEIIPNERIQLTLGDGRKVTVLFASFGERTKVTQHFEAETQNPIEMQQGGWQAILESYKIYTEQNL